MYALLTAMRTAARSLEIAELAVRHRDNGVVGFDIAGAEAGWPPSRHLDAFQYIHRENFHITIHAGEGFGLPSIWEARAVLRHRAARPRRADRRRHRDLARRRACRSAAWPATSATAASRWRCARRPTCRPARPPSIERHPLRLLRQLQFRVTVNTDNRLMSRVTLSARSSSCWRGEFGYGWSDIEWLTINAMKSAFAPFDERLQLINTVIKPGFATARATSVVPPDLR